MQAFDQFLENKMILWHTDNISTALIVRIGSNKDPLQELSNDIYMICNKKDIKLTVTRKYNETADKVSKTIDYDDWFITKPFVEK